MTRGFDTASCRFLALTHGLSRCVLPCDRHRVFLHDVCNDSLASITLLMALPSTDVANAILP